MTHRDRGVDLFERINERLGIDVGIIESDESGPSGGREVVWRATGRSQLVAVADVARVEAMDYWRARVVTPMVLSPAMPPAFSAPSIAALNARATLGAWMHNERSIDFFSCDAVGDVPAGSTPYAASRLLASAAAYALGPGLPQAMALGAESLGAVPELEREDIPRVAGAIQKVDAELMRLYRAGRRPSPWQDPRELAEARRALEPRATEISTGSFGLEAEFSFGTRTSILRVRLDAEHEEFGKGCLMWLLLPYVMNRMTAGLEAHRLNGEELKQRILGPGVGAWTIWPDRDRPTVGYRCFLPNGVFRRGELRRHALGMEVRSRMAHAVMGSQQSAQSR